MKTKYFFWIMALAGSILLGGCAGHNKKAATFMAEYQAGNLAMAVTEVQARVEKTAGSHNELIWLLEAGAVMRVAGQYEQSNQMLDRADQVVEAFEEKAKVSLSAEAGATLTNQSKLPYRGQPYDRIMLKTYRALNFMQIGDLEATRVELNGAYQRQVEAVEKHAKSIEKDQKKKEKNKEKYDVNRAKKDSKFSSQIDEQYADMKELAADSYGVYADYINPLTEFLQGLYFMSAGVNASDLERSAKAMERVTGMSGQNKYLADDMALAQKVASGSPVPSLTYVFFETGMAPHRKSIRIDIPIFIAGKYSGGVDYVGAAFPKLERNNVYRSQIQVLVAEESYGTQLLCSMDHVIARDFKNALPMIITKTLISSGVKAGAAYALSRATKNNAMINMLTRVATTAYQAGMNAADLRTWLTLPKQFQYCRFTTPEDRVIQIPDVATGTSHRIELAPGTVNVVWVKSINPTQPLLVSQFVLR